MKRADKSFTGEGGGYAPDPPNALERWMQYTASYVMDTPTEDETLRQSAAEANANANGASAPDLEQGSDASSSADVLDSRVRAPFLKR